MVLLPRAELFPTVELVGGLLVLLTGGGGSGGGGDVVFVLFFGGGGLGGGGSGGGGIGGIGAGHTGRVPSVCAVLPLPHRPLPLSATEAFTASSAAFRAAGRVPLSELPATENDFSSTRDASEDGTVPVKVLLFSSRLRKAVKLPRLGGSWPPRALKDTSLLEQAVVSR